MTKEELKQAGTKKLISALQYCGRDSYYATYYDEVVDEITQRLNHVEELKKENEKLKSLIEENHLVLEMVGGEKHINLHYDIKEKSTNCYLFNGDK